MHTNCCAYGRAVDRSALHVTLNVLNIEDTPRPWLSSASVHDDREFAVLCSMCSAPAIGAEVAKDLQLAQEEVTELAKA
jgi:hypothetical protein